MATEYAAREFELKGTPADVAVEARPRARGDGGDGALARGLGWFSVGLGVAEVAAPGMIAKVIGVRDNADNRELLRAAGLREIASGVGILTRDRQAGWVWARVGGDVMDLALLGLGFKSAEAQPRRLGFATAAVAGVTALDLWCGSKLGDVMSRDRWDYASRAITINRPAFEVYAFWHDFKNLPRFMRHLESVDTAGGKLSHWVARGPAGSHVEWDAEVVDDRPNELIAWRSLPGAQVRERRRRPIQVRAWRPRNGGHRPHALQPAGRSRRCGHGPAVWRAPRSAVAGRPAAVQAGHGDR